MNTHHSGSTLKALLGIYTPRQTEAVTWVGEGKTDSEGAIIMGCSPRTFKAHVQTVMHKTDCHTRAQLIAKLFVNGVLSAKVLMAFLCISLTTNAITDTGDLFRVRNNPTRITRNRRKESTDA